ncbi:hsp70 nucleotide exchange factor fes1 [Pleurotus pulmonarius]|nr:hsp70 nucleotide exchange factor fes1 [Pleurotus pulmonarius]KAF4600970.1 hsp70 nucleotide exchange factor fes1 [Pleurotus pulmonarius]
MQSLLRWSIENSDGSAPDPSRVKDLDPGIIDMILGKPDAVQMKEDLSVAVDEARSEEDRISALDHLEMLVESIDNANDLEKLKMWEPLHSLFQATSSTSDIKMQALWVIGTALQNNPAAQHAYLSYSPLQALTSFLKPSPASSPQIRSKVIYVLSGLLKHNAISLNALGPDGWETLKSGLQDPDIAVRRKIIFLLNTLILPTAADQSSSSSNLSQPEHVHSNSHASMLSDPSNISTSPIALKALKDHGILSAVVSGLVTPIPYGEDGDQVDLDEDYEEKSIRLLHAYCDACRGEIPVLDKSPLKTWISEREASLGGPTQLAEKWGLGLEELESLKKATA